MKTQKTGAPCVPSLQGRADKRGMELPHLRA
jgi:hypothetical protein